MQRAAGCLAPRAVAHPFRRLMPQAAQLRRRAMSQLKVAYGRAEMGDMAGQEKHCYDSKLVSLHQALATIRPGSHIYLGTGCAAPRNLLAGWRRCNPARPRVRQLRHHLGAADGGRRAQDGAPDDAASHRRPDLGVPGRPRKARVPGTRQDTSGAPISSGNSPANSSTSGSLSCMRVG